MVVIRSVIVADIAVEIVGMYVVGSGAIGIVEYLGVKVTIEQHGNQVMAWLQK